MQKENNMGRVIEATIWWFENVGVENTTRVAVSKQSGVAVRSIQRYFGTLDNLIIEAIGAYMTRYRKKMHNELNQLKKSYATG